MADTVEVSAGGSRITVTLPEDGPRTVAEVLRLAQISIGPGQAAAVNGHRAESLDQSVQPGDRLALAGNKQSGSVSHLTLFL